MAIVIDRYSFIDRGSLILNNNTGGTQGGVAITALAGGASAFVAFDSGAGDVLGETRNGAGVVLRDDAAALNATTAGAQSDASVAQLISGQLVLVYTDASNTGGGNPGVIRFVRIDPLTHARSGPEVLVDLSPRVRGNADIAALGNGGFVIAYEAADAGATGDVILRVYDADATEVAVVFARAGLSDARAPSVAAIAGGFVIAWQEPSGVYFERYDNAGVRQGAARVSASEATGLSDAQALGLADGGFALAWRASGGASGLDVVLNIFNADGSLRVGGLGTAGQAGDQTAPALAQLSDGLIVISWTSGDLGYFQALTPAGLTFVQPSLLLSGVGEGELAALAGGGLIFAATNTTATPDISWTRLQLQRTIIADDQSDVIAVSDTLPVSIEGRGGADALTGGSGDDTLIGGLGADTLTGGAGADLFQLATVNDSLAASPDGITDFVTGQDLIELRALPFTGSSRIVVQQGVAASLVQVDINGDGVFEIAVAATASVTGADVGAPIGVTVVAGAGDQVLRGAGLADVLAAGAGNDQLAGGAGNDGLFGQDGDDVAYGQAGADSLYGGLGNDVLVGGTEGDSLLGEDGADSLFGEAGADLLIGGEGSDGLYGGLDNDTLVGGAGNDTLLGEEANDQLFGDAGADLLIGAAGADTLFGGADNDTLIGGADADVLNGESGADSLFGDAGADILTGADGADTLFGGADNDQLIGGDGADTLSGEDGADLIIGGAGGDLLIGGAGGDRFVYQLVGDSTGAAADLIVDFTALSDLIDLAAVDANAGVAGDQAFVFVGGTGVLTAGQARLTYDAVNNRTLFQGEVNGDGVADLVFLINGNVAATGNFVL